MCCCDCGGDDKIEDLPLDENGVVDFRKVSHGCCRDLYCLIAFILAVIGMIVIFAIGFSTGEPKKLYYPLNQEFFNCLFKILKY
jgi:hypothetical protein